MTSQKGRWGSVLKAGEKLTYFHQFKSNKNIYFRIKDNYVLVTAKKTASTKIIEDYLYNNFEKFIEKINQNNREFNPNKLQLFGKIYDLEFIESKDFSYEILDSKIKVLKPSYLSYENVHLKILTKEICKMTFLIEKEIEANLLAHGYELVPYVFKNVKSYHGECFINQKKIHLNINLAKYDPIFLKYIMYHEYTHFKVRGHGKMFYQELTKLMPEAISIDKKLSKLVRNRY